MFGQVGPRVGSVDPGFGTAYLTRVVGEKKAREIWYLCRQYSAQEALEMRLVNKVVPAAQLMDEARAWAREILAMSPTAIKIAKASFAAETDHIKGIGALGGAVCGGVAARVLFHLPSMLRPIAMRLWKMKSYSRTSKCSRLNRSMRLWNPSTPTETQFVLSPAQPTYLFSLRMEG
jgi:hypothetical protein